MEKIDNTLRLYQNCIDYHRFIYRVKILKLYQNTIESKSKQNRFASKKFKISVLSHRKYYLPFIVLPKKMEDVASLDEDEEKRRFNRVRARAMDHNKSGMV